jgi:hypothetical protein
MYYKVLSVLTAKIAPDIAGYVDHFRYALHKKKQRKQGNLFRLKFNNN